MKKSLFTLFAITNSLFLMAQDCSETVKTTTPTVNIWDWRGRYWNINYITTSGLPINYNMDSPFYDVQNLNVQTLADKTDADKDFKPEDGWELIQKDLGTASQATRNPYVVLYNKNTARLRVFFLVTQLYSEVGTTDSQKGGIIKIGFTDGSSDATYAYQSNLLTANASPILPLDKFNRDILINTPNIFRSTLPYWLYADAPVMYDPCTCKNKGKIFIRAELVNTAQVDITIKSLPYQSPVNGSSVNGGSDFLTAFTNLSDKVSGGVKAFNSVSAAADKLVSAADRVIDENNDDLVHFYNEDISGLKRGAELVGNFLELLPATTGVAKSVVSLVDYFVSGGKKSSGPAPAPVMIMNDFKATGTITSQYPKNQVTFSIPGSDQTSLSPALIPLYNNALGIFNLVETPVVEGRMYSQWTLPYRAQPGKEIGTRVITFNLRTAPKYVLNPALSIDYTVSDIRAALIMEGCNNGVGSSDKVNNLQTEEKNQFRTSYYPISCINQAIMKTMHERYITPDPRPSDLGYRNCPVASGRKINLKITARLKKRNSSNPNEDIVFVATYPTTIADMGIIKYNEGTASPVQVNIEDTPENYTIPTNTLFTKNTTIKALNDITISTNVRANAGVTVTLMCGGYGEPHR